MDNHSCRNTTLNPQRTFIFFHIFMNAKAIVLRDTTIMEKLFSHQTSKIIQSSNLPTFCQKVMLLTFNNLSTFVDSSCSKEKSNFQVPNLWIKLFKSATEITCIKFPKKKPNQKLEDMRVTN